jgi:two-component system, chemotaxis family, CheB/CheR fusion protein
MAQGSDDERPGQSAAGRFPIVAVGGSAGALSAFRQLLEGLPGDAQLALVVVTHQEAGRDSLLAEILARSTPMPVTQVVDGVTLEPGRVYVGAPGRYMSLHGGVFRVEQAVERGHPPLPVDSFMRSLAHDQGSRAVGIVVSGTGSDGTLGLAAIRSESGLTLAQTPAEAEFAGMPSSAIAAGVVDLVLAVSGMGPRLVAHAQRVVAPPAETSETAPATDALERILELVAKGTGHDFSGYKRGTLQRRIERRLHLFELPSLSDYLHFVERHPEELDALRHDWLIGVSGFFRDHEAFQVLEAALAERLPDWPAGSAFRVWVPGCANGQEAYSIAILLLEVAEKAARGLDVRVFATDLDDAAIDAARAGRYPEGIAAEVSPERLRRFFSIDDRHFVVKKDVRERVVFSVQDLLSDPPFTRMDLISCRNLLIYFNGDTQKRILPLFHYSLNPNGLLFLGSSESTTGFEELFSAVSRERKIFCRNDTRPAQYSTSDWATRNRNHAASPSHGPEKQRQLDLGDLLRRQLAERYAPAALLVDEQGAVEQIHGRTGDYLEPAPGQPTLNVLDMARNGLRAPLAAALREVAHSRTRIVEREVHMRTAGGPRELCLRVAKVADARISRPLFLVTFDPAPEAPAAPALPAAQAHEAPSSDRLPALEAQLRASQQDHQSTVEQLQAANEELASANEEVQSMNEELQSANEELQTSKEETQSLNEELHSVNAELQAKVSGLEQVNDDLRNLIDSTGLAIVFADETLRVKRFTPAARLLIPLIVSDIGRPLGDIATSLDYPGLLVEAENVLHTLIPSEREVRSREGGWFSVQIRPYRTARNTIEGVSIAFLDVTRTKQAELTAAKAQAFETDIVQAMREPILVLDAKLRVLRANRSFLRAFRVDARNVEGRVVFELGNGEWDIPRLRELLERLLPENSSFEDFEVAHDFPSIGRKVMLLNARRVERTTSLDGDEMILLAIEDVTERKASSAAAPVSR